MATANVPEYPKTTHPTSAGPAPKACPMAGWETADADVLATVRNTAAATIARMAAGDRRPLAAVTKRIRCTRPEDIRWLSKWIRVVYGEVGGPDAPVGGRIARELYVCLR